MYVYVCPHCRCLLFFYAASPPAGGGGFLGRFQSPALYLNEERKKKKEKGTKEQLMSVKENGGRNMQDSSGTIEKQTLKWGWCIIIR